MSCHTLPSLFVAVSKRYKKDGTVCVECLRVSRLPNTLCHLFIHYFIARFLLTRGKCGKGEGKSAEAKANKGKASSDSFTIGSCKEDPG